MYFITAFECDLLEYTHRKYQGMQDLQQDIKTLSLNVISASISQIDIKRKWSEVGMDRFKGRSFPIINYNGQRLVQCPNGYVLLCGQDKCTKLPSSLGTDKCREHNNGESYQYCRAEGCPKQAIYGIEQYKSLYCLEHKFNGMINVMSKRCEYSGCMSRPSYGNKGERPIFCSKHKLNTMVDVIHKTCEFNDCMVRPSSGNKGESARFCSKHRLNDMINVVSKRCEFLGCMFVPSFANEGEYAKFCEKHKLPDMNNVTGKRCKYPSCKVQATFNAEGEPAKFCSKHKLPDMNDVRSKRCKFSGCMTRASYGIEWGSAEFCSRHRLPDMYDVKSKRCEFQRCMTRPSYGIQGMPPKFCSQHKLDTMINVVYKHCEFNDCITRPTFGYYRGKPQYCANHKLITMIDVVHQTCEFSGCTTRPIFGYREGKPQYCSNHKLIEMIDLHHESCQQPGCLLRPSYGKLFYNIKSHCREHSTLNEYSGHKSNPMCCIINCRKNAYFIDPTDINIYPIRCEVHRFPTDIELINRHCINCDNDVYFPSNRQFCAECGGYREKTLYHFKEIIIKSFLQTNNISFAHDRPISLNGSKKRPDFLIETKFGYIILEVDEHQHNKYTPEREIERMHILYNDMKLVNPIAQGLFIRYNPDGYESDLQHDNKARMDYLYNIITHFITMTNIGTTMGKIMLYYDNFNGRPQIEGI